MSFKVNINICRVCMKSDPDSKSLVEDVELRLKFLYTTSLTFSEADNMPAIMCTKCVTRLKVAYDFVQLAHASEKNLKEFLNKISNDFQMFTTAGTQNTTSEVTDTEINVLMMEEEEEEQPAAQQKTAVEEETLNRKSSNNTNANNAAKSTLSTPKQKIIKDEEEQSAPTRGSLKQELQNNVSNAKDEVVSGYMVLENDDYINEGELTEEKLESYNENTSHIDELDINEISDDDNCDIDKFHEDDGESHAELEMLEENLQQPDGSGDLQAVSAQHDKDGYLKEYEAMLEENVNNYAADNDDDEDGENSMEELHLHELEQEEPDAVAMQTYVMVEDTETSSSVAAALESVDKNESTSSSFNQFKPKPRTKHKTANRRAATATTTSTTLAASKVNASKAKKTALSTQSTRFYCMKCNRDFSTKTNLTRHMSTHEGFKPYQCTQCGKKFTQNGSLKQHMYTHTGEKPYVCEVCDRGFTQCKSLVFHMRRHTGEKPFPCDQCGLSFRQKDGLKAHILKHHMISCEQEDGAELLYTCIICKKHLEDAPALQMHMKKHINNHRGISASSDVPQSNMLLELMDDDELLSEKAFISEELALDDDLEDASTHVVDLLATSAAEPRRAKKFQCRQCFKCFAIKKNLLRHLSIHTVSVSELFQCKTCEIAFDTNLALKSHRIREHKEPGAILNHCDECEIFFPTTTELNEHISLTHDLNCTECAGLSFKSQKLLMEHMLEHELNEMNENI